MNVLFLSIDSLRPDFLGAYRDRPLGFEYDVSTPNLDRFAQRAAVFETHYAGSMPCMPARREWLCGVSEFLWRPWGPVEPFDTTLPLAARNAGIMTALLTDHYHYFQHGSSGYFEDFNGYQFLRGQEYDPWRTSPKNPDGHLLSQTADERTDHPHSLQFVSRSQYARNADALGLRDDAETEFFSPRLFQTTTDWLEHNDDWNDWFLYVDSFDVHEPFHVPEPYASMYTDEDPRDPSLPIWPYYGRTDTGQSALSDRELAFVRSQFAGQVTMTDHWFGTLIDALDRLDLWSDTAVVVTSDHGFFLGEHGWVGKRAPPTYNVTAKTPLLIWHPELSTQGTRVNSLTSAVDIYATILDLLDVTSRSPHSRSLTPLLENPDRPHRDWALYGYWGSSINVTDGEYTYLRPCGADTSTDCYSTMMMNAQSLATTPEPEIDATSGRYLPYTDAPVWRFEAPSHKVLDSPELYDVTRDPLQENELAAASEEQRLRSLLVRALDELNAPDEQYERVGVS